ncbi:MAG: sensor histidine kinase [Ilumatobacteraceae bacterium]
MADGDVDVAPAPRVWRWWRSVPTLLADGLLAAVVLVVSLTEVVLNDGREGGGAWRTALLVAMAVVIVFRRQHPIAVWIASGVLVMIYGVANFSDPTLPYAPLIAVYTAAAFSSARVAARVGAITALAVVVSMILDPRDDLLDWLVALLSVTTAWLVGNNVRVQRAYGRAMEARAADLERDHALAAERAAADERLRLARELHDVAAHHVSVIALHAEAGQSLLPDDPARAGDAFAVIGDVARTTLTELRRVVGVLRDDAGAPRAPQPGLRNLPALVAEVGQAGVPVTLHVTGAPRPISGAVDASAYRIVQEALTNVLRHAAAAHAEVTVTYAADTVSVEVLDDGKGPAGDGAAPGHGLVGMRERAAAFGGSLTAAARPGGGFAVSARLPA